MKIGQVVQNLNDGHADRTLISYMLTLVSPPVHKRQNRLLERFLTTITDTLLHNGGDFLQTSSITCIINVTSWNGWFLNKTILPRHQAGPPTSNRKHNYRSRRMMTNGLNEKSTISQFDREPRQDLTSRGMLVFQKIQNYNYACCFVRVWQLVSSYDRNTDGGN